MRGLACRRALMYRSGMHHAPPLPFHRILLGLLTLALLSLPFAHRTGAAPLSSEMAQYLAIGGSISEICGGTDIHPAGGCESCRIVQNADLAQPQTGIEQRLVCAQRAVLQTVPPMPQHATSSSPPPARAPPLA